MEMDIHGVTAEKLRDLIEPTAKTVLEVGCGEGRVTARLAEDQTILTAIDISIGAIASARASCRDAFFTLASGERLPFRTASFDCVVFMQSLHHQDSRSALAEARRVRAPGGIIVAVEPVIGSMLEDICGIFQNEAADRLAALYALMTCGLKMKRCEIFETIWRFEGRDELLQWLFDYYDHPFDPLVASRIDRMLGGKAAFSPLDIQEKLLLAAL